MEDYRIVVQEIKRNIWSVRDEAVRRKARLIMRAIEFDGGIGAGCDNAGLAYSTFRRWIERLWQADFDLNGLKERSRRPHSNPKQFDQETEDQLCRLRQNLGGAGGHLVAFAFKQQTGRTVSHSGVDKVLSRRGVVAKSKKKPNTHKLRYSAEKPLQRVQFDTVWLGIEDDSGNRVYAIDSIDDHSRYVFARLSLEKSTTAAKDMLLEFLEECGPPELVQTDNGTEFTFRFVSELNSKRSKEPRLAPFESELQRLGIRHYLIRPRTPQLNGKIERFHRTLLRAIRSMDLHGQPLPVINHAVQQFIRWYNNERPHASLNYLPPAAAFFRMTPIQAA